MKDYRYKKIPSLPGEYRVLCSHCRGYLGTVRKRGLHDWRTAVNTFTSLSAACQWLVDRAHD